VVQLPMTDTDRLPVAVLTYDAGGTVIAANKAAAALLGSDDLVGTNAANADWTVTDAAGWPDSQNQHPAITAARVGAPLKGIVSRLTTPQGAEVWVQIDATPVKDETGAVEQVVMILTDITHVLNDVRLPRPSYGAAAIAVVSDQIVGARLDPQDILKTAVQTLIKVRPGTWLATLMNKDPRGMRVRAASDTDPQIAEYIEAMQMRTDAPPLHVTTSVIESGEPVLMPNVPLDGFMESLNADTQHYLEEHPPPPTDPATHMGVAVVPMRARDAIVGALGLFERVGSNPLTQRDLAWIQEVANRIGLAADNAQLYVDAISRLERLTALRNVQLAITAGPDLRLTLRVILDQAVQGLSIDAADVLLVDESDGMLSLVASTGFRSTSIPDYRFPVDEGVPGQTLAGRRMVTVTALSAFSQFRRRSLFAREGFKAYGAVPLISRTKLTGVLEIFHRSELQPDHEWLEFLEALGTDAALAIEHASLQAQEGRAQAIPRSAPPTLSSMEKEILGLVADGLSNKAIAEKVHMSSHTVKFHVGQMLDRAGVTNRTELARKATREGWV
jgi:PAS domain S-box-containing protein